MVCGIWACGLTVSAMETVSPREWRRRATVAAALARDSGRIVDIVVFEVGILGKYVRSVDR